MKSIYLFLTIALLFNKNNVFAQFIDAKIYVNGLTCSLCSMGVEKALRKLPFISDVTMDLNSNLAEISFKSNSNVDISKVAEKIREAGFSVRSVKVDYNFKDLTVFSGSSFNYFDQTFTFTDVAPKLLKGTHEIIFLGKNFMGFQEYTSWKKKATASDVKSKSKMYLITL